jgi:hypothetical protein
MNALTPVRSVCVASVLLLAVALTFFAASARAAWTSPVTLSAAGRNANSAQVAIDAQGDAVFVWRRFDGTSWRIQTRARSASGTLGPVQNLSPAGQDAKLPQVGVDSDGDAVFAWRNEDGPCCRIQSRARSAAGALGPVQTLSTGAGAATLPQVGMDGDGDAVFVWQRSDGTYWRVQIRTRSATGTLGQIQTISATGHALMPQVAVNPVGRAVFTWQRFPRIETRTRTAAGALSQVQTLSPPPAEGRHPSSPQVGVDAQGNAVFVWNLFESAFPRGATRVQARARTAAGALSPIQNLVWPPLGGGGCGCSPQVAVDPTGDAVFSWEYRPNYLDSSGVQVRARSAAGSLSPIQNLTAAAGHGTGSDAQVGIDADGDAVVAWQFGTETESGVAAQVRSAAGTLGPLQTFPSSGFLPHVAVNGAGDAALTWQESNGTNFVIKASAGP